MKKRKIGKKAFTLLELSITIVIIGILTTVVITALSGQRIRAYDASALSMLDAVRIPAHECVLGGSTLSSPPTAGTALCGGAETWPTLPTGWTYSLTSSSDTSNYTFIYSATSSSPSRKLIYCTDTGCIKSGF